MDKIKQLSPNLKKIERKMILNKFKFKAIFRNQSTFYTYYLNTKKITKTFQLDIINRCKNIGLGLYKSDYSNNLMIHDKINNEKYINFLFIKDSLYSEDNFLNSKAEKKVTFLKKVFSQYNKPGFFSVLGPEGVGKTTLCRNLSNYFNNTPFEFYSFHHTGEWKKGFNRDQKIKAQKKTSKNILKSLLPNSLKNQIGSIIGEKNYFVNMISILFEASQKEKIILSDRYCYDRYIRWKNLRKPLFQILASKFFCLVLKKPVKCFILIDNPYRIQRRKNIMPIWEIKKHQEMLVEICTKYKVNFKIIDFSKYNEKQARDHVVDQILECQKNIIINSF